jgi:glycosyltransferase involved in cell wall biosynthesis
MRPRTEVRARPLVLHVITSLSDGGAQATLFRLITASEDLFEHQVISLTGDGKYGPLLRSRSIRVICLDMGRPLSGLRSLFRLMRLLRRTNPDVIQTWMYHADLVGGVAGRMAGHKNIFWNIRHGEAERSSLKPITFLVAKLCALTSRSIPRAVIACAQRAKENHLRYGYRPSNFLVIPNGYDEKALCPSEQSRKSFRSAHGIGPETILYGMVARWNSQKDHQTLISSFSAACADYPAMKCLLVGEGCTSDNAELVGLIDRHRMTGRIIPIGPQHDIASVMNGIDFHILSSAYGEAFPNVVAEAMLCGTPCLVTDVGDAAAIVDGNGWVVPPKATEELAAAVRGSAALAGRTAAFADLKIKVRDSVVERFTIPRMVMSYRQAWFQPGAVLED